VYFLASPTNGEAGLWKTDGTPEGTALLKSMDAGNIEGLHAFNNNLFFRFHVSDEYNLWKTDGTEAGTVMVKTLASTDEVVLFSREVLLHDLFYFIAYDYNGGVTLWNSDGTEAQTLPVKHIDLGSGYHYVQKIFIVDDILYFFIQDLTGFSQLWKSDGTEAGTVFVEDGVNISSDVYVLDKVAFFQADEWNGDYELWKADFNVVTGVEESLEHTLTIYPNPSSRVLSVKTKNGAPIYSISIYDSKGGLVEQRSAPGDIADTFDIHIETYRSGSYIVMVKSAKGIYRARFIKK
jgi:ELWxxDGT repeat protein